MLTMTDIQADNTRNILTLIPLAATGLALGYRNGAVKDRAGLKRGDHVLDVNGGMHM